MMGVSEQTYFVLGRNGSYLKGKKIAYDEISVEGTKKNKLFVEEYRYRFIAKPLKKHDFTDKHFVIREKSAQDKQGEKFLELEDIIADFTTQGFFVRRNSKKNQSAPLFRHYHAATFLNVDDKLL